MSDQFVAEIRIFGFNFAPRGWAICSGQILPISQNTALFSLVGTQYGGNGTSNFALPNLQGAAALDQGSGPGLTQRTVGDVGGEANVTLSLRQLPQHTHSAQCVANNTTKPTYGPGNALWSSDAAGDNEYNTGAGNVAMNTAAIAPTGGGQPHNNLQPYLALNFCIALQGIFPPRS